MRNYGLTAFGGRCEAIEAPDRKPRGREVLVEATRCGVCHSDVHIQDGYYDLGGGKRFSMSDRGLKLPVMLGHEIVGRLVEIGPESSIGTKSIGQDFILFPWIGCGECEVCRAGQENICTRPAFLGLQQPGGSAERLIVPDARYLVPLDGIDYDAAATYACSGLTVFSALKKLDDAANLGLDPLIGAGGLGQMAIGIAKALGFGDVVVADLDATKREQAMTNGADRALDPASEDGRAALVNMAGLFIVGSPKAFETGIAALRRGGRYVVVGLFGGEATVSIPLFTLRPIAVMVGLTGTLPELRELLDLVRAKKPPPAAIELRPRAEINAALDAVRAGTAKGRIVLTA